MDTATSMRPDLGNALITAASLIASAALVSAAGATAVSVTVSGTDISVQVPPHAGDEPTRAATVAAYAHALTAPVHRHPTATRSTPGSRPAAPSPVTWCTCGPSPTPNRRPDDSQDDQPQPIDRPRRT